MPPVEKKPAGKIINQTSGDYKLNTTMMLKVLSRLSPTMAFTSDLLHANVRAKQPLEWKIGHYALSYIGQPDGTG